MYDRNAIEKEFIGISDLYHYTTVDTLKKIISSRTLKFNRNDRLNDLIEGIRSPYVKYYVSCFTYDEDESIPMWYIYCREKHCNQKSNSGVRLRIMNNSFFSDRMYFHDYNKEKVYHDLGQLGDILYGKVIYDDNNITRCPSQGTDSIRLTNVVDMGLYCKASAWKYENEARFYIIQPPQDFDDVNEIFVELQDSFFQNLEITFSPLMTDEYIDTCKDEIAVLLGGKEPFKDSALKNRIRLD